MKKVVGRNRDKQPNRDNSPKKENYITVLVFGKLFSLILLCIIIAKSLSNAVQNIPLHFSVLSLESSSCRKQSAIFAISSTIYLEDQLSNSYKPTLWATSQFFGVKELQYKIDLFLSFRLWLSNLLQVLLSTAYQLVALANLEGRLNSNREGRTWLFFCPFPALPNHSCIWGTMQTLSQDNSVPKTEGRQEGRRLVSDAKTTKMQQIIFSMVSPLILRKYSCSANLSGIVTEKVQGMFHSKFPQCC